MTFLYLFAMFRMKFMFNKKINIMKYTVLGLTAIVASAIGLQYQFNTDWVITAMSIAVGFFLFGKVAWAYSFLQGYGVGLKKGAVITVTIIMVIIGALILAINYSGYQMLKENMLSAGANTMQLSLTMASAYIVVILYWIFYARKAYFYGSEYEARCELKYQKGYPDNIVEEKIVELKKLGIIK